jgi:hypothetical protein
MNADESSRKSISQNSRRLVGDFCTSPIGVDTVFFQGYSQALQIKLRGPLREACKAPAAWWFFFLHVTLSSQL